MCALGQPFWFPVAMGAILWIAYALRSPSLRALILLTTPRPAENRAQLEETTMRFMIMHKNDPRTEAGEKPPMELVQKMGEFIGGHAKAGSLIDGAGLGASATRTRLTFRDGAVHGEARPLPRRARAAVGDAAAEGQDARRGDRLGRALRQDPRHRRDRARQGERAVGHRPHAGAREPAAADPADREGRPGVRGRRAQRQAEGRPHPAADRDDQGRRARPRRPTCSRAPRPSAWCSRTTTCGWSTVRSRSRRS